MLRSTFRVTLIGTAAALSIGAQSEPPQLSTMVRQKYAPRTASHAGVNREQMLAIDAGLEWLYRHQDADGRWNCDGFMKHDKAGTRCDGPGNAGHDVGVTGLAVLTFLASNHTLRRGTYSETVSNAVRWLKNQQQGNGFIGTKAAHDYLYDHAIATLAVVEAYGVSEDKSLRQTAQQALDYLEFHRNPKSAWRYQPRDGQNDVSATTWCTAAYAAGKDFQLRINESALTLVAKYMDVVADPTGHHGYTSQGEGSARKLVAGGDGLSHSESFPSEKCETTTAVGLFCRFLLGKSPELAPVMTSAADLIAKKPPAWNRDGSIDFYYWYYGSNAMFQMGGKHWNSWSKALRSALLPVQRVDGNFAGSWDPVSVWGEDGGRIYATTTALMSLQAEFRYARTSTILPLPDESIFRGANADWRSMRYGKFATKLNSAARNKSLTEQQSAAIVEARTTLAAMETRMLAEIERTKTERAYFTGRNWLEEIADQFRRRPPGKAATDVLAEWRRDPAVKRELTAMKRFESIQKKAKPGTKGQLALKKALVKFLKKYGATTAGQQARDLAAKLK